MKQIDASEHGIFEISWSADSQWVAYVRNETEVCIANVQTNEIRIIGTGRSPGFTANNGVVYEAKDEIHLADGRGDRVIVSATDICRSGKRNPCVSPDGKVVVFVVETVFHKESQNKNAYPLRHFLGMLSTDNPSDAVMLDAQWYGGTSYWFPDSTHFGHFEYDSTGGARIHVNDLKGKRLNTMFGLYPAVSPDGKRIVCKPRSGQSIVVYTLKGDSWENADLDTVVYKLPESTGRLSGSPPQWMDNRHVIIDEGGKVFRVDTRKEDATEMKKIPVPTLRGTATMCISPNREQIAVEVETEKGFALRIIPLG